MSDAAAPPRRLSTALGVFALGVCVLALLGAPGCSTPGSRTPIDVGAAPRVTPPVEVGHEIGLLLSADPEQSAAAERRLNNRTDDARDELLRYAATIPNERDPRWLSVLDEQHALPPLADDALVDFLVWKGTRDGDGQFAMRAQSRLLDLARTRPGLLIARIERGGAGVDAMAIALATAGRREAVPVLLERYLSPRTPLERRAAIEALARLAGESRRPRLRGSARDRAQDAAVIRAWFEDQQARSAERGLPGHEPEPVRQGGLDG